MPILTEEQIAAITEAKKRQSEANHVLWNARAEMAAAQGIEPDEAAAKPTHDDDTNNCNCKNNC